MRKRLGVRIEPVGERVLAADPGEPGQPPLGIEDVALDLGEGDRGDGLTAGPIADGIARVLPALIDQPSIRASFVLDEPVAVAVAVPIDPIEGGEGVGPQPIQEHSVAGPVERGAQQDEPERRGVDRAVVRGMRQFSGPGHLAAP